jgi:hypothetical protein
MQQVRQRELPEQMSWARAVIFATGFFFLAAILIGQLPGYVHLQFTASSLEGLEQGSFGLAIACLGGFIVVQVIVLLFDPKPVIPPAILTVLGIPLALIGFALSIWATATGCTPAQTTCNQFFPTSSTGWAPVLGGKFLWFQANALDFVALGLGILGVGLAMIFYSQLAIREQRNPDRRDLGTTPTIRWMIVVAVFLLIVFMVLYTMFDSQGWGNALFRGRPFFGLKVVNLIEGLILGVAIFLTLGAFALRLHYLMRPVRKRTMPGLYAIGALGLAQLGVVFLLIWAFVYPLITWMHSWSFIGLGDYLTLCSNKLSIPASCTFTPQAGYIITAIITTNFFALLMAAVWAWKSNRSLVVVGSVVITAVIAATTLLIHTSPDKIIVAMMLCAGMLVLAVVWTSTARREFAVVGENNLGCLGQWLVVGTCLFIYLAAFAFFSMPVWAPETEPNIPFTGGLVIPPPATGGAESTATLPVPDAMIVLLLLGVLAAIQFFFLTRNRYKV